MPARLRAAMSTSMRTAYAGVKTVLGISALWCFRAPSPISSLHICPNCIYVHSILGGRSRRDGGGEAAQRSRLESDHPGRAAWSLRGDASMHRLRLGLVPLGVRALAEGACNQGALGLGSA